MKKTRILEILNTLAQAPHGNLVSTPHGDLPVAHLVCKHCDTEIICGHKCIQALFFEESYD